MNEDGECVITIAFFVAMMMFVALVAWLLYNKI
jgi:hypothetical protein